MPLDQILSSTQNIQKEPSSGGKESKKSDWRKHYGQVKQGGKEKGGPDYGRYYDRDKNPKGSQS